VSWQKEQDIRFDKWVDQCLVPKDKYLDWGSPLMNQALRGAEGGTSILIGGAPNHGKSTLLTSTILTLLEKNSDVMVLDFTIDDSYSKRVAQYIANMSSIVINDIIFAHSSMGPVERKRFGEANEKFKNWIKQDKLVLFEAVTEGDDGEVSIQASSAFITSAMREAKKAYPNRKLVVAIDALNDVDISSKQRAFSELDQEKTIVKDIHRAIISTEAVALITSHLRKNESRRPTLEDLKGNSHLAYCGKVAIGVYNDSKAKHGRSDIMWTEEAKDGTKVQMPILEAHFLKSKTSDFNGVICFQQWPALGRVVEPDDVYVQKTFKELVYRSV